MSAIDDLVNFQALNSESGIGQLLLQIGSIIVILFVLVAIFATLFALIYALMRFLRYNIDAEIWEKKGEELTYYGDDKVMRDNRKGMPLMKFLKNRSPIFENRKFPTSDALYRKKFFGTKIKLLLDGDELIPFKMVLGNPHVLKAEILPSAQKMDFIQRVQQFDQDYKNREERIKLVSFVIGVAFVGVLFFGLFVIWQSNVATAEATKALAQSIVAGVSQNANTFSAAPG